MFIDIDDDTLTYKAFAQEIRDGEIFIPYFEIGILTEYWLHFDEKSKEIYGIPSITDLFTYEVKICAYDLNKNVCDTFKFDVKN